MQYARGHALQTIAVVALFCTVATAQSGASANERNSATAKQIIQLVQDFLAVAPRIDPASYEEFFADDALFTGNTGHHLTKADLMRNVKAASGLGPDSLTAHDFTVHIYGDEMAVATFLIVGHKVAHSKQADVPLNELDRATATFLLRDGKWQAVALQITKVQEEVKSKIAKSN